MKNKDSILMYLNCSKVDRDAFIVMLLCPFLIQIATLIALATITPSSNKTYTTKGNVSFIKKYSDGNNLRIRLKNSKKTFVIYTESELGNKLFDSVNTKGLLEISFQKAYFNRAVVVDLQTDTNLSLTGKQLYDEIHHQRTMGKKILLFTFLFQIVILIIMRLYYRYKANQLGHLSTEK